MLKNIPADKDMVFAEHSEVTLIQAAIFFKEIQAKF